MRILSLLALAAIAVNAQTVINGSRSILGDWDASGATSTQPVKKGLLSAIPGTCTQGQFYFATDATAGLQVYHCSATNTWSRSAYAQGSADPGTCTVGQLFVNTNSGATLKLCTATNTWTAVGTGGSSSGVPVWTSATAYTTNQQVYTTLTENSTAHTVLWRAGTNCTSGGSFNATEVSNCQWTSIGGATLIEDYTTASGSPFTWNKPLGAKNIRVICIGSGAGGGSGARQATTSIRTGGAGGGAGGRSEGEFDASAIASTVTVTIGAGGGGGGAKTTDNTNGTAGSAGAVSTFGSYLRASASTAGGGAAGSTTSPVSAGTGGSGLISSGANGGTGTSSTGGNGSTSNYASSGGGGGGGAAASSTTAAAGGAGGGSPTFANSLVTSGAGGTTGGTAPTQGTCNDEAMVCPGPGGGQYITNTAGGTGAAGLKYGAGGGGGGASDNGFNSGAGGNGADGACRIITRF